MTETIERPRRRYAVLPDAEFGDRRVLVKEHHGEEGFFASFTARCSGCGYEGEEESSPVGSGCWECGYTGKRRHTFFTPLSWFKDWRWCGKGV